MASANLFLPAGAGIGDSHVRSDFPHAPGGASAGDQLYSSAIFVGWGAVILGLILERIWKDGIGAVTASAVGVITLIIAHNLALGGDTMEMLRAVLDTNF